MRPLRALIFVLCLIAVTGCTRQFRTQNLQHAAAIGSVHEVRRHLSAGADVNARDRGWTALALAAEYGRGDVIPILIEAGAEVDDIGSNTKHVTPLALAARGGNDQAVAALLDAGANPEVRGAPPSEMPALEAAVAGRHLSTVRLLLSRGASPDGEGEPKWPPLVRAATNNDVAIIRELLEHGAGENREVLNLAADYATDQSAVKAYETLVDAGAETELIDAAAAGSLRVVDRLLNEGANPNERSAWDATPLYAAASEGHAKVVERLLSAGAETDKESFEWSPLAAAAHEGHDDVVRALLDAGAKIDSRRGDPEWRTPLEIAVEAQRLSTVGLLLDRGAAIGPPRLSYWPIIIEAAVRGDPAIVSLLLDHGAGESPGFVHEAAQHAAINGHEGAFHVLVEHGARPTLASAAALGDAKTVRRLLDAGRDPNKIIVGRFMPLHAAARRGHTEIVKMLLDAGADPEKGMRSALYIATQWQQREVVETLVASGAKLNDRGPNNSKELPLEAAVEVESPEMVSLLLELGADPSLKDDYGRSPLTAAARTGNIDVLETLLGTGDFDDAHKRLAAEQALEAGHDDAYSLLVDSGVDLTLPMAAQLGNLEAVERLIAQGADPNATSEDGSPALVLAARQGHGEVVNALLAAGATVDAQADRRATALHAAAREGHLDVARRLLDAGADVSLDGGVLDGTPLHRAAAGGHLDMIRLLIAAGADPDAPAGYTKTRPLHEARWAEDPTAVVELLVELGADPNGLTDQRVTPLNQAAKAGEVEVVRALLEAGADPDLPNSSGNSARDLAEMARSREVIEVIEEYD